MIVLGRNQVSRWSIGNSLTPIEGPKTIGAVLDFSVDTDYTFDALNILQDLGADFSMVQSIYLDLSGTDAAVTISVDKSGQKIIAKGRTQGYYPVVCPNLWKLAFNCTDALAKVPVVMCNYAVAPGVWAATV